LRTVRSVPLIRVDETSRDPPVATVRSRRAGSEARLTKGSGRRPGTRSLARAPRGPAGWNIRLCRTGGDSPTVSVAVFRCLAKLQSRLDLRTPQHLDQDSIVGCHRVRRGMCAPPAVAKLTKWARSLQIHRLVAAQHSYWHCLCTVLPRIKCFDDPRSLLTGPGRPVRSVLISRGLESRPAVIVERRSQIW
jgi:hypothetical protein